MCPWSAGRPDPRVPADDSRERQLRTRHGVSTYLPRRSADSTGTDDSFLGANAKWTRLLTSTPLPLPGPTILGIKLTLDSCSGMPARRLRCKTATRLQSGSSGRSCESAVMPPGVAYRIARNEQLAGSPEIGRRVGRAHCCARPPSDPDVRVSAHPAQASRGGGGAGRSAGLL